MVNNFFWRWEGAVAPDFCSYILNGIDWETESKQAKTFTEDAQTIRNTDIVWRHAGTPIYCLLRSYIQMANESAGWDYDIKAYEPVQIAKYADDGCYGWHKDIYMPDQNNMQRKLTAVLLLSDRDSYVGGELQFKDSAEVTPVSTQGSIIVFPSFLEHQVTPVIEGVRYSATCWSVGPAFR